MSSMVRMMMLFVSSWPSTVPMIRSFERGVGPTVTVSPSWTREMEPWS
jgi:hypothetical protein